MTYRHLQQYILEHDGEIDLPRMRKAEVDALSRAILIVGKDAPDVCAYISSIMKRRQTPHFAYLATPNLELRERFIGASGRLISVSAMLDLATQIICREHERISSEALLFQLSLGLASKREQLSLISVSEEFYIRFCEAFVSQEKPPFAAAVICTDDSERETHLRSFAPRGVKAFGCSTIGEVEIFRESLLGIEFVREGYRFTIASPETEQVRLAALASEIARKMLGATRVQTYLGLYSAAPPNAALLYSAVPTILLKVGKKPTSINPSLDLIMITEGDFEIPSAPHSRMLFYGDIDYIHRVKTDIDSGKYSTLC